MKTHHFNNFYHGLNTEVIEECGEVLFHLDAVVVHLGHGEDAHLALPPNLRSTNRNTADASSQHCCIVATYFTYLSLLILFYTMWYELCLRVVKLKAIQFCEDDRIWFQSGIKIASSVKVNIQHSSFDCTLSCLLVLSVPCAGGGGRAAASACLHRGRSTTCQCDPRWSALRLMGRPRCFLAPEVPGELWWFPWPTLQNRHVQRTTEFVCMYCCVWFFSNFKEKLQDGFTWKCYQLWIQLGYH